MPQEITRVAPCRGEFFWKKGNTVHYPSDIDFDEFSNHMIDKLSRRNIPHLDELVLRVCFQEGVAMEEWVRKFVREVDETNLKKITIYGVPDQSLPPTWAQQLADDLQAVTQGIFVKVGRDMYPLPERMFIFIT